MVRNEWGQKILKCETAELSDEKNIQRPDQNIQRIYKDLIRKFFLQKNRQKKQF